MGRSHSRNVPWYVLPLDRLRLLRLTRIAYLMVRCGRTSVRETLSGIITGNHSHGMYFRQCAEAVRQRSMHLLGLDLVL